MAVNTAVDIARQIAQGLGRAHQSGLVHPDIKPAHVMIGADGLVKIVDFGLAKLTGDAEMTRTGTTLGAVAYMSPEQARGGRVDGATDVWALGVVLYEMLAGARPFTGKDEVAVLASILNDRPASVTALRPEVPDELERIVTKMLEKDLEIRYRSTQSLLADLTACRATLSDAQPQPRKLSQFWRRPVVAIPAVVFVLLTATAAALSYRQASRTHWARIEAIPRIIEFIESDDYLSAFNLAREVESIVPSDPILATLWPQFSAELSLTSDPEDADVYVQPYGQQDDRWEHLGRTPLSDVRLGRGTFRFRLEKVGFAPTVLGYCKSSGDSGELLQQPRSQCTEDRVDSDCRCGHGPRPPGRVSHRPQWIQYGPTNLA